MTWEELAPYGVGTPDANGIYPDYNIPRHLKPSPPKAAEPAPSTPVRYVLWADLVRHWDLVERDLAERYGIDMHDPGVLARPWPGICNLIRGLPLEDSRVARALLKETKHVAQGR